MIEALACVGLALLLVAKGILPGWQSLHTDFPNYYLVARLVREGYSLDRIYDWIWLQRIKDHWGIDQPLVGFAGLTPFSALPVLPISMYAALTAKRIWIVVNLLLLGTTAEVLSRATTLGRRRVWLLCLLCVFPLRTNFMLGQMHLLVLCLIAVAWTLHRKQQHLASAVCLGIAGMLKVYPLLFVAYFVWKRQWPAVRAMCAVTLALIGFCVMVFGPGIMHTYLTEVLPRSLTGEILDPYSAQSGSMAALFHKLFIYEPELNPSPWRNSPKLYSLLYPIWQAAVLIPFFGLCNEQDGAGRRDQLEWAAWVFALLLLSPVPASYHFVVMTFSMVLLVDFLVEQESLKTTALALFLYCMVSLVEFMPRRIMTSGLLFSRLWICIAFWMLLLFCLWKYRDTRQSTPWQSTPRICQRSMVLCGLAILLWVFGARQYRQHFAQLPQDASRRMTMVPQVYLSAGPRATPDGLVFPAMLTQRYRILDQTGQPVTKGTTNPLADELAVAASPESSSVLIEIAESGGSHLIAKATSARAPLQNAESPAISPDGSRAGFLREVKGRGSLWILPLNATPGTLSAHAVRVSRDDWDVRNFALENSGWMVVAAKSGGETRLFQFVPGGPVTPLLPGLEGVDSPAISPDERLVAFTRRVSNRWQLEYFDRQTKQRELLTSGDCNAYSPQWVGERRLAYATDCGRGLGLTALASVDVSLEVAPVAASTRPHSAIGLVRSLPAAASPREMTR